MKNLFKVFTAIFLSVLFFTSCNEDTPDLFPSELVEGAYIINYGDYGGNPSSIDKFDYETNAITNNYYLSQNNGLLEMISSIQYAYEYKDSVYLLGNNVDQLITVDPLFQQTQNGVTKDIEKPRYCVAEGDYLYISCWGADADFSIMANTYIAKFNIKTNSVESRISVPGGPEGLAIANGNLYAALNYVESVAVINLDNNALSYIVTPAVTSYFIKDTNENLYVSLVNTYSNRSTETGLGYINTKENKLETVHKLEGVSSGYSSIMTANSDFSKIYVLRSVMDYTTFQITDGGISTFDVSSKTFSKFNTILSANGISVNPNNDKVYLFTTESVVEGGTMTIFSPDGTHEKDFTTGASPIMALFLE